MTGKNRVVLPALLALGLISTNANASDPCASVLCLYGKAKKKGSIRWSKTFDARKAFLNQCSTADPAAISKIMSKFGKVKG